MMRTNGKPPLARSPIRLRSRRVLQSNSNTIQTPPPAPGTEIRSKSTKTVWDSEIRPEYHTISCELRALAEKVKEVGNVNVDSNKSSLFERGRFYDEYSARRNERLRKKKEAAAGGGGGDQKKSSPYGLGVRVEKYASATAASKRKKEINKLSLMSTPMTAAPTPAPRYSLRSSSANKENVSKPNFLKSRSTRIGSKTTCKF